MKKGELLWLFDYYARRLSWAIFPENRWGDLLESVWTYRCCLGRFPNLVAPRSFSEWMTRMKVIGDELDKVRALITDKEEVKQFIAEHAGDEFVVPTIAVLRNMEEARQFVFPVDCVVKPTHTSGDVIIRRQSDPPVDLNLLERWFHTNYYPRQRERNYRSLTPKIIIEELLTEGSGEAPADYKVFCFKGVPAFVQIDQDRFTHHRRSFYSADARWHPLPFEIKYPSCTAVVPAPKRLAEMLVAARSLSNGFPFLRVDFYCLGNDLKVGELTNFPEAGYTPFSPPEADLIVARLLHDADLDVLALFSSIAGPTSEGGNFQV